MKLVFKIKANLDFGVSLAMYLYSYIRHMNRKPPISSVGDHVRDPIMIFDVFTWSSRDQIKKTFILGITSLIMR